MRGDRKWWRINGAGGRKVGISSYAVRREVFEAQVAAMFGDDHEFELVEISAKEAREEIKRSQPWVKEIVRLRELAVSRPVSNLDDVRPSYIPHVVIDRWDVNLSLDVRGEVPHFHLSAKFTGKNPPKMKHVQLLGRYLEALGAVPRPDPMDVQRPVFHFRWVADVDFPGQVN